MENIEANFLSRNCPSCGKHSLTEQAIFSCPKGESLNFAEIKSYWSGFFKEKVFFTYRRCDCGLLYCPTYFTESQLQQLYKSMADNTAGVELNALKKTQQGYFKALKKYSPLTGDYLEFGPDIGLFTDYGLKEGQLNRFWLCEPNKDVWPVLEAKVQGHPYHLMQDMQELKQVENHSISVAVFIHVLDHILDPCAVLKAVHQKLTPGAILLIVTHDESSLLAKVTKSKWPPYCLQHPQLFNQESTQQLLQQAGFAVLHSEKSYNYFPIMYLLQHALFVIGIKNAKLPRLEKFQVGLKLGNILTVAKAI